MASWLLGPYIHVRGFLKSILLPQKFLLGFRGPILLLLHAQANVSLSVGHKPKLQSSKAAANAVITSNTGLDSAKFSAEAKEVPEAVCLFTKQGPEP